MKTKALIIIIAAAVMRLAQNSHAQDIDSFAPVVVKTVPKPVPKMCHRANTSSMSPSAKK